jgi:hypothetical protein
LCTATFVRLASHVGIHIPTVILFLQWLIGYSIIILTVLKFQYSFWANGHVYALESLAWVVSFLLCLALFSLDHSLLVSIPLTTTSFPVSATKDYAFAINHCEKTFADCSYLLLHVVFSGHRERFFCDFFKLRLHLFGLRFIWYVFFVLFLKATKLLVCTEQR